MKQTIRIETFETNSSSYHSISIHKKDEESPTLMELEVGKKTILDGNINYRTIGCTSAYTYTSRTKLDKANMILRFVASESEEWLYEQPAYDDIEEIDDEDLRRQKKRELILTCPVFTAMKKVINEYTQAEVEIPLDGYEGLEFKNTVWDDEKSSEELLGLTDEEFKDETKLIEAYKRIIFDDKLEITEECESNE